MEIFLNTNIQQSKIFVSLKKILKVLFSLKKNTPLYKEKVRGRIYSSQKKIKMKNIRRKH